MRLHLGCGKRDFGPDWVHCDLADFPHVRHRGPVDALGWCPDNAAELIYASHVLEYFDRAQASAVLAEWRRVLAPGGILRLAVPNARLWCGLGSMFEGGAKVIGPLWGRWPAGDTVLYHRTGWWEPDLIAALLDADYTNVRRWNWHAVDHGKHDDHSQSYWPHMHKAHGMLMSLNLEAEKP